MIFDPEGLALLREDLSRRLKKHNARGRIWKGRYVWSQKQYRTLIWYRLMAACRVKWLRHFLESIYHGSSEVSGLEILCPKLAGGVIMPHWGRITLNATSIGRNLYVFHNVSVGHDYRTGTPSLGEDVFLGTGAIVLGKISIGDHVIVAAGSVVISDVPSNSLVAGNPARVIRRIPDDEISRMIGY